MSDEQVLDPRIAAWLHDGPTTASDWVSRMVIDHARDHPRHMPAGVRWGKLINDLLAGRPAALSRRLAVALVAATLLAALAGVGYLAWRQNSIVLPVPTPTPTSSPAPESPAPTALTGVYVCPPDVDANRPGPADQPRPQLDQEWRTAVDAESGVMVVASGSEIWLFDLCTNTWRKSAATTSDGRVPVYDAGAGLIVMLGARNVTAFDAAGDVATELGPTPIVGHWEAVYDPVGKLVVARDERTSRMWTYQVASDEWRELTQAGDVPPVADVDCDIQLLGYDAAAARLVLMHDPSWCFRSGTVARTYEFDPRAGTWQDLSVGTPSTGAFDWLGPRMHMAYDSANALSVIFDGRNLYGFDGVAWEWTDVFHRSDINAADGGLTHFRVPLAYDPINGRIVMLGGDPLARSDGTYLSRPEFQDVSAIDLATMTWTELLAGVGSVAQPSPTTSAVPTPIVERTTDTVGDAPSVTDIVLATTSVADGVLTLKVTLAGDWPTATHESYLLGVNWVADNRRSGSSGWGASCNPYVATYRSFIAPDGAVSGSLPLPVGQKAQITGPTLRLNVPLEAFGDPTTLGFSLATPGEGGHWYLDGGDWFPDPANAFACHSIPLSPAAGS